MYDHAFEAIHSPARNIIVEEIPRESLPNLLVTVELTTEGILDMLRLILHIDTRSEPHIIIVDGLSP